MKITSITQFLILLILCLHLCSSVKVPDERDENEDEEGTDETDYDDNKPAISSAATSAPVTTRSSSSKSTTPASDTHEEDEGSDGETSDDEEEKEENADSSAKNQTTAPYAVEGESLRRLQQFVLNSVETVIKSSLPMIVRSASETNVSTQCSASFLNLISALRESKLWAFKSKEENKC